MSSKNTFSETITNRYALALYELANEYSDLENIENQSKSLLELLKQSMDFRLFVKDPTSEKNEQIKSIEIIAEKGGWIIFASSPYIKKWVYLFLYLDTLSETGFFAYLKLN